MFVCGKHSSFKNGKRSSKTNSSLKTELKKMKRNDIIHVLDEQGRVKAIRRVLELHGRQYMQLRINRADATSDNILTFKICLGITDDVRKYYKLIIAACQFSDEVVLFHSLDKHFSPIQRQINDAFRAKSIKYEPLGACFEVSKDISTYLVDNLVESLQQQLQNDSGYELEVLRLTGCHLKESHIYSMQRLIKYVQRLDLTGNDSLPSKAVHILSNILLNSSHPLKSLNLSSCNIVDNHLIDFQPALNLVKALDLSYNEEMTSLSMKIITSSLHIANLTTHLSLSKLILAGCNLQDEHIQQLYNAIYRLEYLDLSGNTFLTPNAMKVISDAVVDNQNTVGNHLKDLRLENCALSTLHVEMLSPCVSYLKGLDVSWNVLSVDSLEILSSSFMNTISSDLSKFELEKINLTGCELSDFHLSGFINCVKYLKSIRLGYNRGLTTKSIHLISKQINEPFVVHLCDRSSDTTEGESKCCPQGSPVITNEEVHELSEKYPNHKSNSLIVHSEILQTEKHDDVTLNYSDDKNAGTDIIKENETTTMSQLKYIDLSSIQIDEGTLEHFLTSCKGTVESLELSLTNLTDEHIKGIQDTFPYLTELHLGDNSNLTPYATKILSDVITLRIKNNEEMNLQFLNLKKCKLEDEHIENLAPCIKYIKGLNLSYNPLLTPKAIKLIGQHLSCEPEDSEELACLKELSLASCGFKDKHIVNLSGYFSKFEKLDISVNTLTFISMLAIQNDVTGISVIDKNSTLKELNIHQAFCLRDYHYRKFENILKPYGVKVISVVGNRTY